MEFTEAESNMNDLVSEYQQVCVAGFCTVAAALPFFASAIFRFSAPPVADLKLTSCLVLARTSSAGSSTY